MADINIEFSLLARAAQTKDFAAIEKAQITESYFESEASKQVFIFMRDYYHRADTLGEVPSVELIRYHYSNFMPPVGITESVSILAAELRRAHVQMRLRASAQQIMDLADSDPTQALAKLRTASMEVSALADVGHDLSMSNAYDMLLNNYQTIKNAHGITGIPYPWQAINEETQGLKPHDYIVLYGRPKSMKTWVGLYIGVRAYRWSQRRVLFYTREMSPNLVAQRVASLICEVDYHAFKNGKLNSLKEREVWETLRDLKDEEEIARRSTIRRPYFTIISDRGSTNGGGASWLGAKIREMDPDLVIVDGMYLMKDDASTRRDADWKVMTSISRSVRMLCMEHNVPIIGITQANRGAQKTQGADLTELAYADALGQDADAVFRVNLRERVDEGGRKRQEIDLVAVALREGKLDGITIHAEPGTNFSFIKMWTNTGEPDPEYGSNKGNGSGGGGASGAPQRQFHRRPETVVLPRPPEPNES